VISLPRAPLIPFVLALAGFAVPAAIHAAIAPDLARPVGSRTPHEIVELAGGLSHPWSLVFLPDGAALISERTGGLRVFREDAGLTAPLPGLPPVFRAAEGGLLGLALDPAFAANRRIFLCVTLGTATANGAAIVRARLTNALALEDAAVIFEARPLKDREQHFACRILFSPDGFLLVPIGDGYHQRDQAQTLDSHLGKIVRITVDGQAAPGNPFHSHRGARPGTFTLGHRNVQGLAQRPGTREIWMHEHGPRGGDEVNVLRPGANYGWPATTFGIDYSGEAIAATARAPHIEPPSFYWVPSIAPSGMAFYDGARFPEWRGDLFVGALAARSLRRLDIESDRIIGEEILLAGLKERIRDVVNGPDGCLYVLTDAAEGKLLRIQPPTPAPEPTQPGGGANQ